MAEINQSNEPQPDRWYDLSLGSSFKEDHSSKFCSLRYDFKPASIDKDQRGSLHKTKDNKVTFEFPPKPGKPKVLYEGCFEDHKENEAVLFFDGKSFRLERLHRAVKRVKLNRHPGESNATASGVHGAISPPLGKGNRPQPPNKDTFHPLPVEVERIEVGEFKASDAQPRHERTVEYPAAQAYSSNPSPELDIVNNDDNEYAIAAPIEVREYDSGEVEVTEYETGGVDVREYGTGIDINVPQADVDDEIDLIDDEEDKGQNAAEALKARLGGGERDEHPTSSSSDDSSESGSGTGSGSGSSSSSDAESTDLDSV